MPSPSKKIPYRGEFMKIRIHRSCALAFISVLWLFAFSTQEDLHGQTLAEPGHPSQSRGRTGNSRKANDSMPAAHYSYEVLYNFCSVANCADGDEINNELIRDAAGNLYGVAWTGGNANPLIGVGDVFEVDPAGNETTLYSFCSQPNCADGAGPNGLIMDSAGNIYGTANGGGANMSGGAGIVFELSPPAQPGAAWTETVLYNFCSATNCSDGFSPFGGIIRDAAGNIYGTTQYGGAGNSTKYSYGTVYELSPPSQPGSTWTETVLHVFCSDFPQCNDGMVPNGDLVRDAAGNLYGTTTYGPPASNGILGSQYGSGTAFQLAPPPKQGGAWTETVLYFFCSVMSAGGSCADGFQPRSGLIMDASGNLYGTAGGGEVGGNAAGGTAFELAPPTKAGGAWTETVLYNFCSLANCADGQDPMARLTQDSAGNLFGTTTYGGVNQNAPPGTQLSGTAFELSPPAQSGSPWTETVLYNFCSAGGWSCTDGDEPEAGLLSDPVGNLYGGTWAGGSHGGGLVFMLALPSFTVAGTSVSLSPGATTGNTSTITLYPHGGFTGQVTLAAAITSEPAGAQDLPTLSFGASNSLNITDSSAVSDTLTITTTASTNAVLRRSVPSGLRGHTGGMTLALGLIVGIGICFPTCGHTRRKKLGSLLFLVILASGLLSCSAGNGSGNTSNGSPGTTPGSYVVTVTGTSGSMTVTGILRLTVR